MRKIVGRANFFKNHVSQNSIFRRKFTFLFRFANEYALDVNLEDKVDIYCPQYSSAAADDRTETFSSDKHYQTIYMVSEESFNSCRLGDFRSFKKVRNENEAFF